MVSTLPLIFNLFHLFSKLLEKVPWTLTTIGSILTFIFHNFFCSLVRSKNLYIFSPSFIFTLWSAGTAKSSKWQVLFFILINTRSGFLTGIGSPAFLSKLQIISWVTISRTDSELRNTICQNSQILTSCTIPRWFPFSPNHV